MVNAFTIEDYKFAKQPSSKFKILNLNFHMMNYSFK